MKNDRFGQSRSRGFGFVTFAFPESARGALQAQVVLGGRLLEISPTNSARKPPSKPIRVSVAVPGSGTWHPFGFFPDTKISSIPGIVFKRLRIIPPRVAVYSGETRLGLNRQVKEFGWRDGHQIVLRELAPVVEPPPPSAVLCHVYVADECFSVVLEPFHIVAQIPEIVEHEANRSFAHTRVRISLLDGFGGGHQLDNNERISNLHLADESCLRIESIVSHDLVRFQISYEENPPVEMPFPPDIHVSELLRLYLRQQGISEPISRFQVHSPVGPQRGMRWLAPHTSLMGHSTTDVLFVRRVDDRPLDQRSIENLEMRQIDMSEYEKREFLGRGAFGTVTRYVHQETQDEIAVKVIDVGRAPHALREVHLLSQLNHPCILSLIGIVLPRGEDPSLLIATEMIRPGSLEAVIRNGTLTDATVRAKVVVGIVLGMRHLHSNKVIHRDLKPANVLVDSQWQVRISDFGTSQVVDVDLALSVGVGTPCYQSPEVIMGTGYSFPADVYAFGCICYEIFTGKKAIPGTTVGHLCMAASTGIRPKMPAEWSPWFQDLVGRSWQPEQPPRPTFHEVYAQMKAESFRITADVRTDEVLEMVERIAALEADAVQ